MRQKLLRTHSSPATVPLVLCQTKPVVLLHHPLVQAADGLSMKLVQLQKFGTGASVYQRHRQMHCVVSTATSKAGVGAGAAATARYSVTASERERE